MHKFIFHPNGLTDKRIVSSREIVDIAYSLYVDGWRYDDRARLIVRYGLTDEEAGVMTSALRLYE